MTVLSAIVDGFNGEFESIAQREEGCDTGTDPDVFLVLGRQLHVHHKVGRMACRRKGTSSGLNFVQRTVVNALGRSLTVGHRLQVDHR